jgi:hypothetical protein
MVSEQEAGEKKFQIDPELSRAIYQSVASGLVTQGEIDPEGLTEPEFAAAVQGKLAELLSDGVEFGLTVDHMGSILDEARSFRAAEKTNFAIMFYATWIEHWLNWMYIQRAARRDLQRPDVTLLIRQPLHQKTGIIWTLMFGQELDAELSQDILAIARWRNTFVHYKWQSEDEPDSPEAVRQAEANIVARAEVVVERLTALEDDLAYSGAKEFLERL